MSFIVKNANSFDAFTELKCSILIAFIARDVPYFHSHCSSNVFDVQLVKRFQSFPWWLIWTLLPCVRTKRCKKLTRVTIPFKVNVETRCCFAAAAFAAEKTGSKIWFAARQNLILPVPAAGHGRRARSRILRRVKCCSSWNISTFRQQTRDDSQSAFNSVATEALPLSDMP